MWPPYPAADGKSNPKIKTRITSSSSSFSRSSSSSSSFSSVAVPTKSKRKSMEEVWKHINLATLAHEIQPPNSVCSDQHHFNIRGMILQDFLASTFESQRSSPVANELPQFPLSPTALSLNNGLGGPIAPLKLPLHNSTLSSLSMSAKKHPLDEVPRNAKDDRQVKRMMKNRESAARSRARKQAYTNELEVEVANRAEENARLKKQNEELRMAIAAQIPKKDSLQRTSSAPI